MDDETGVVEPLGEPAAEPEVTPPQRRRGNYAEGQRARRERERGGAAPAEKAAPKAAASRPKRKPQSLDETKRQIAEQLRGGHELAALFTGLDTLRITDIEATMLAGPFVDTCVELGIPLDGKLWAPVQLAVAMGMVYGPKVVAIRAQILEQRARRAQTVNPSDDPPADRPPLNGELVLRQ